MQTNGYELNQIKPHVEQVLYMLFGKWFQKKTQLINNMNP
jgi:hypothetical protein